MKNPLRVGLVGLGTVGCSVVSIVQTQTDLLRKICDHPIEILAVSARDRTRHRHADVLEEAKRLGYAEADPSFDIDGIDAAQKLALLSSMAYGVVPDINNLYVEGIRGLSAADVAAAEDIGYVIKLIAKARYHRGILHQAVYPALIPNHIPLAHVDDVFNGVLFKGDFVGEIMVTGRGAGGDPTASAIMADLIDLANHRHVYPFKVSVRDLIQAKPESMDTYTCRYYVRFMLRDVAGAVSHVARILADHDVSIRSLKQPEAEYHQGIVPLILTTHECQESVIQKTLSEIRALDILCDDPKLLRVEPF